MQNTFFCIGKFLKWLAGDESSSITKGSIYYIKHMYIQPFSMGVDWREIWHQMDVSTMFYICRYCVLLCGADLFNWALIHLYNFATFCNPLYTFLWVPWVLNLWDGENKPIWAQLYETGVQCGLRKPAIVWIKYEYEDHLGGVMVLWSYILIL